MSILPINIGWNLFHFVYLIIDYNIKYINNWKKYQFITCYALWGPFDDALLWVQSHLTTAQKCFVSLGSMFGNDHFECAVKRLRVWRNIMGAADLMLLGLDACHDRETVIHSYNDDQGFFHQFIRNGFTHSNDILGQEWYRQSDWTIHGELSEKPAAYMHQFVLTARKPVKCSVLGISFPKGQRIVCYEGFKHGPDIMQKQFASAGLTELQQWQSPSTRIFQYMLRKS